MNEPNKTYSIDEIKELLDVKDDRTVGKHINAAGYDPNEKESYSEEEVGWIREVQIIKRERGKISYPAIKAEIDRRKAETQKQRLLGGGGSPSAPTPNTSSSSESPPTSSAVPAQPAIDTDFIGGIVQEALQEQVKTHVVRSLLQLPSMINQAVKESLPELQAAANIALQQNRERLEPMRKVEAVTDEQNNGETIDVDNTFSEDEEREKED